MQPVRPTLRVILSVQQVKSVEENSRVWIHFMPKTKFFQHFQTKVTERAVSNCFENAALAVVAVCQGVDIDLRHIKGKSECSYNKRHTGVLDWNDRGKAESKAECERHHICADKSQTWCADDCVSCYIFSKCKLINELLDETPACWK